MKDRVDYERMRAAASPVPSNGPSGEVSVTLDCRRCGEAGRALDETCPRCAAPIERLPAFWWCALPVGAAAVRVRRADLNRAPRAARAGAPPRKPASDRETLVVIERTGRLTRWARRGGRLTGRALRSAVVAEARYGSRRVYRVRLGDRLEIRVDAPVESGETVLDLLVRRVVENAGSENAGLSGDSLSVQSVSVSAERTGACLLGAGGKPWIVAKFPLTGRMKARCEENLRTLGEAQKMTALPGSLRSFLPRPVGTIDVDGHLVCLETALPGSSSPLGSRSLAQPWLRRRALTFLEELHEATREETVLDRISFEDRVGHYCDRLASQLPDPEEARLVVGLKEALRAKLEGRPSAVVFEHGDFHLGNCLFGAGGARFSGVIDWDLGSLRGFAVLDLLHLLVTTEPPAEIDDRTALRLLSGDAWSGCGRIVSDYLAAVGMGGDVLRPMSALYILAMVFAPFLQREGGRKQSWYKDVVRPNLRTIATLAL